MFRRMVMALISLCLVALAYGAASAQDSTPIQFDQNTIGELSAESSAARYALTVSGGETATVQVLAISPGFVPRFRILNPAGVEILTVANPKGLASAGSSAAFADAGTYTIVVEGENGTLGQFVLSLQPGVPQPEPVALSVNQPVSAEVSSESPVRVYRFSITPPDVPPLAIESESDADGAGVLVSLYNEDAGKTIATHDADVNGVLFRLPSVARTYRLEVRLNGSARAPYTICLGTCDGGGLLFGAVIATQEPVGTEAAPPPGVPTCRIVSNTNGAVNIRSGPGTQYAIVGNLPVGQTLPVLGQLSGGGWYQVSLVTEQLGWISATVARLDGDCAALPLATAPSNAPLAPTQPPAPPPPAPTTSSGGGGGTAPTAMPTGVPTVEPPAAPPEPLPDLSVAISYAQIGADGRVDIGYSIVVAGVTNPFSYQVQICIDDTCISESFTALTSSSSGTSRTLDIIIDGRRITHRATVTVDSTGDVVENNESNNVATYTFT